MFVGPRNASRTTLMPLLGGQSTSVKLTRASKSPGNLQRVPTWPPKLPNGGPAALLRKNENWRGPVCSVMAHPVPKRSGYQIVPSIWSPAKSSETVTGLGAGLVARRGRNGAVTVLVLVDVVVGLVEPCICWCAVGAMVVGVVRRSDGSVERIVECARCPGVWRRFPPLLLTPVTVAGAWRAGIVFSCGWTLGALLEID